MGEVSTKRVGLQKTGENISRWFIKPENLGKINIISLKSFSDTSDTGYGQSNYLSLVNVNGKMQRTLLMGIALVTPKTFMLIPRIQLVAAVVLLKISNLIKRKLGKVELEEKFVTDKKVILW